VKAPRIASSFLTLLVCAAPLATGAGDTVFRLDRVAGDRQIVVWAVPPLYPKVRYHVAFATFVATESVSGTRHKCNIRVPTRRAR
jgi:hypothetical protein